MNLQPVPLDKAYRLLNHGPTVILSTAHGGRENAMSASWVGLFDFDPAKITAIIDRAAYTRCLIEESGYLGVQVPFAAQVAQVVALGSKSGRDNPHKLADCGVETFYPEGHRTPLIKDCAAYLICRLIPEPHNQENYDLVLAEAVAAWADTRVFRDGHWHFDDVGDDLKTLHYVAGGQFYRIGSGLNVGHSSG